MKTYPVLAAFLIIIQCGAWGSWDAPVVESREVLENAAAAGDAVAQFKLAVAYQEGDGGPKDMARALALYRKAAAGGVIEAQYNLGVIMTNGVDAPRDFKEAARWFYAAAQNGYFDAQKAMMRIYAQGQGVAKSPATALAWDLLTRRTLELRYGVPVGVPPKPGALRVDGAAAAPGSNRPVPTPTAGGRGMPTGIGQPRPAPFQLPPGQTGPVSIRNPNYEDPTAFAPKPDIALLLGEITQIEAAAGNFAGATDADYQRARAGAAAYYIPLSIPPPQKTVNTPAWLRERTITQTTLHESPLVPILDDRSKVIPFGPHGADLIKLYRWKHAETDHFIVHYTGENEARLTVQYIEGAYAVLTQLLNLDPQRGPAKSHVFVLSSGEWKAYLDAKGLPPQLAGFAYKTELLLGAATDKQDRAESIKVLCHEVTHALVARYYGALRPPLWLNEGLAEYIALRTMRSKGLLTASNSQGEKKAGTMVKSPLEVARLVGTPDAAMDVPSVFNRVRYGGGTSPERLRAFYANSQKCLQTLFERLPAEGFANFFNMVLAGNSADSALGAVYGKQCENVAAFQRIVNGN
jgi:hypothetical protein